MCNLVENFIFRLFVCFVCLFVFVLVSICHMFRHSIVDLVEYSIKRSKTKRFQDKLLHSNAEFNACESLIPTVLGC